MAVGRTSNVWSRFVPIQFVLFVLVFCSLFASDVVVAVSGPSTIAKHLSLYLGRLVTAAHVEAAVDLILVATSVLCFMDWIVHVLLGGRAYRYSAIGQLMDVIAIWSLLPEWWIKHGATTAANVLPSAAANIPAGGAMIAGVSIAKVISVLHVASQTYSRWFGLVMTHAVPYWRHIRLFRLIKLTVVGQRITAGCCGGSKRRTVPGKAGSDASAEFNEVEMSNDVTYAPLMVLVCTTFCVQIVCLPPLAASASLPDKREHAIRALAVLGITIALNAVHQFVSATAAATRIVYVPAPAPAADAAPAPGSPAATAAAIAAIQSGGGPPRGSVGPRGSSLLSGPRGSIVSLDSALHSEKVAKLLDDSDREKDRQLDEKKRTENELDAKLSAGPNTHSSGNGNGNGGAGNGGGSGGGSKTDEHIGAHIGFDTHLDTPIMRTLSFLTRLKANPHVKFGEVRELIDLLSSSGALDAPTLVHHNREASITGGANANVGSTRNLHAAGSSAPPPRGGGHHRNSSTPTGGTHGTGSHDPTNASSHHNGMIRDWLMDEVAHHEDEKLKRTTSSRTAGATTIKELLRSSHITRDSQMNLFGANLHMVKLLPQQPNLAKELTALMDNLDDWNVDTFRISELTSKQPLLYIGYVLFQKYGIFQKFKVPPQKLVGLLTELEKTYGSNPYHNHMHGTDVTLSTNFMLHKGGLADHVSDWELFAVLLASMIHDANHPGNTNKFEIKSKSEWAMQYNDVSPLENHHLAYSFALMRNPDFNILSGLSEAMYERVRGLVVELVLATDLKNHFHTVTALSKAAMAPDEVTAAGKDHSLILKAIIKMGDVGHSSKSRLLHMEWTGRITEEFYAQGDKEKALGLEISPFCDRTDPHQGISQVGFFEFIVFPLYNAVGPFLAKDTKKLIMDQLNSNAGYWKGKAEEEKKADAAKPPKPKPEPKPISPTKDGADSKSAAAPAAGGGGSGTAPAASGPARKRLVNLAKGLSSAALNKQASFRSSDPTPAVIAPAPTAAPAAAASALPAASPALASSNSITEETSKEVAAESSDASAAAATTASPAKPTPVAAAVAKLTSPATKKQKAKAAAAAAAAASASAGSSSS